MSHYRHILALISLLTACFSITCSATDLFVSEQHKAAFLKALGKQDARYDRAEKMIHRPFSSPGYHTTLKGGYVHPTRESLSYAVALLDSGQADRLKRAEDILRRVISLQDQDPNSRTYGIWSWFMEEPLEKMSPPDWNWADFCGTQLLQVALDHMRRLPNDLQHEVKQSTIHAAYSIKRRNVGPGYTNIALMGTYVTLVSGEIFGVDELREYGKARLRRFYNHTLKHGSFSEYNSPTYSIVAIRELARMLQHVRDRESQELLGKLNRLAWRHVARHFHAPTRQWAGPHSRCYSTLLRDSTLAFIQRATNSSIHFVSDSKAFESLDAHRLRAKCPQEFFHYFTDLPEPRLEVEAFARNAGPKHDIIGTTYLHPDFTLASINIGDLWNQRRPLLAYWNTGDGVVAMRLRCLHDGYDYSSASIFTVQDKASVLGAVVFATDRGDTHISLDRLKNATIKAKDLRIRLQFEGATGGLKLPPKAEVGKPIDISSGPISCAFNVAHAVFDNRPIRLETGSAGKATHIDIILYSGTEKSLDFRKISQAAVVFALSVSPRTEPARQAAAHTHPRINRSDASITATWHKMALTVPTKPTSTKNQRNTASAQFGSANPWKMELQ